MRSQAFSRGYLKPLVVADLLCLVDVVTSAPPYLASAVAGGAIYVAFAARHPDRVAGVVWHGAFAQSVQTAS
jgi:pimeloyl-ACP methyl ester carboxylesterase